MHGVNGVFLEIILLLAVAVVAVALFRRLRLPPILAYLITGAFVGPHGLGWISDTDDTRFFAEFGVVFLLFTVGLEFSLPQLIAMRREVLGLGGAQVTLTTLLTAVAAWLLGLSPEAAMVVGGALAMSSTAIVVKQLNEQLEMNSRHGRLAVGILLFQDVAVVPFLIIIPALAGTSDIPVMQQLGWALLKGIAASAVMLAVGHWLLRRLFREVASARSAELFTLTVLLFSLAAAGLTHMSGLSMALGAFLAGMMLGETEYRHQVEADIRPFRDVLLGLFFVTIGMLLNVDVLWQNVHWVLLLVAAIVLFKAFSIMGMARISGAERGVALRTGAVLAQGGEFGFALLALALSAGLLAVESSQIVLAAIVVTMALSPFLIRYNGHFAKYVYAGSYGANRQQMRDEIATGTRPLSRHVVICGYGRIGQNIARFVERENVDYVALDLDPIRVQEARAAGDRVFYGDSTHIEILEAAGIRRARTLVVSFDEDPSALKIIRQVRELSPDLPILVRTRDDANLEKLQQAGATEVVPETLEASLMLVSHLLYLLGTPMSRIVGRIQEVRNQRYQMLRHFFPGENVTTLEEMEGSREALHAVTLPAGAYAVGRTPADLRLDELDIILSAIRRGNHKSEQPRNDLELRAGDVLVLYGAPDGLESAKARILKG